MGEGKAHSAQAGLVPCALKPWSSNNKNCTLIIVTGIYGVLFGILKILQVLTYLEFITTP